nr:MAG TPA: hypothetical protein [Bacteriophage sp.]
MNFWHIYLLTTDYFNHGIVLSPQIKFSPLYSCKASSGYVENPHEPCDGS